MGPSEDGHFHPPLQRRHLLGSPAGTQKFTFHNTRVQDLAQAPPSRLEARSLLPAQMKEAPSRRGGYVPSSPASWSSEEGPRMETSETDSLHSQEQRDPRLKRKPPPQMPVPTQVATATKRKQDIHLIVHQILSEHSYCKGGGDEIEPQLEIKSGGKSASSSSSVSSSFLSVVGRRFPSRSRLQRSARKKVRSATSKPEVQAVTSEALNGEDPVKDKLKLDKPSGAQSRVLPAPPLPIRSCLSHPEELSRLCCVSCHKLICRKCVGKGRAHHGHDYGLLQWDGRKAMLVRVEPPVVGVNGMAGEKGPEIGVPGAELESKGEPLMPVVGDESPQVDILGARSESKEISQGPRLKPVVGVKGAQAEKLNAEEAREEPVCVKESMAGVKGAPSVLDPTKLNSDSARVFPPKDSRGVEFDAKIVEKKSDDDFVVMGDFDLDIDSDGFSSSDEVMTHSHAEAIAVKDQEEPSYIISLPTTRSRPMANPSPDTQAAETADVGIATHMTHTTAEPSCHDTQAGTAATSHPNTPDDAAMESHLKADGSSGFFTLVTGEDTSGDTIQAVVEATESLKKMLDDNNTEHVKGGPSSQWSISNYDPRKNLIRFSRVDKLGQESYGQLLSNRLALYASNSSPSGSSLADSCELSYSEDTPLSGEGNLDTPSLSSLDSASSLLSFPGEERVGWGMKRGRGTRGRGMRQRNSRKCVQMTSRRTRAAMVCIALLRNSGYMHAGVL